MNIREFNRKVDWAAREAAAPKAPATLAQQAPLNRPAPETLLQQQQRASQFKGKMREQWERDEQERIRKLKHKHYARVNGKLMLVAGKPPTGGVGKFHNKSSKTTLSALPPLLSTTGHARYGHPLLPWNNDGIVAYDASA